MTPTPTPPLLRPGAIDVLGHGPSDDPRAGFVLSLVVFLLFAIGIAGAASYQVVLNEAVLAVHAKETQSALSIARAGLQWYVGNQIGVHDDRS